MSIAIEKPNQEDVLALIQELDAYQDSLYPPEARYALDIESLMKENVLFAVARSDGGVAMGCGALVLSGTNGELKRMFVKPQFRSQGIAQQLLNFLERQSVLRGCHCVYLETGPYQSGALRFYERQMYLRCGPFGDYQDHPLSVFMKKDLDTSQKNNLTEAA